MVNEKQFKLVSVVMPAYKQEHTIAEDISNIKKALKELRFKYEMTVVVDGSPDKTYERALTQADEHVKVVQLEQNHGKGYAVRYGMKISKGDPIAFIDAGMDIDPYGLAMCLEHMLWYEADIIVGSKRHPASKVKYPGFRRFLSFFYQSLTFILFGLKVRDTQVGLKFYRRQVIEEIIDKCNIDRFAFDVEMLALANHYGFNDIYEAPVEIRYNFSSTIRFKHIFEALRDTFRVWFDLLLGNYDKR